MNKIAAEIISLTALLSACTTSTIAPPASATHWVRSDDWGEYSGVYLYSQKQDGSLWWTHYAPDSDGHPAESKQVGYWLESDGHLQWMSMQHSNLVAYMINSNGVYIEQHGRYYVPVELTPKKIQAGQIIAK